ncbi:MAG: M20/M25/M40 family metallo-hydrolase [Halieaceae bacterium]
MHKLAPIVLLLLAPALWAASAADNLAQAIRFPTISHQGNQQNDLSAFSDLHDFLRASYPLVFSRLQVEVINEHSLLIIWPGSEADLRPVLFTAHMDVVPIEPGTEQDWPHPPFAGVIEDGFVYGRGTLDDKIGVISLLEAAQSLLAEGWQPQRGLVFGFGHDEEIGGLQGAAMIAARMRERGLYFDWMVDEGSYVISDNPLLPARPAALIGVAEKAYLTLILRARGKGGHSSTPPPQTPIGRLAKAVAAVEANPLPAKIVAPVDAMLERTADYASFPENMVFSNLWLTGGFVAQRMAEDPVTASFVRTTTALTIFNAGVKDNVIPQLAEARINFRLLPGDTPDMVIAHVKKVVDDPGIEIERSPEWAEPPPLAAMQGGGFDVIGDAAQSVYAEAAVIPYMMSATTDVRHYIELADNHYRFHGAEISLSQTRGIHGTGERIAVQSVDKAVLVARQMLTGAGERY